MHSILARSGLGTIRRTFFTSRFRRLVVFSIHLACKIGSKSDHVLSFKPSIPTNLYIRIIIGSIATSSLTLINMDFSHSFDDRIKDLSLYTDLHSSTWLISTRKFDKVPLEVTQDALPLSPPTTSNSWRSGNLLFELSILERFHRPSLQPRSILFVETDVPMSCSSLLFHSKS